MLAKPAHSLPWTRSALYADFIYIRHTTVPGSLDVSTSLTNTQMFLYAGVPVHATEAICLSFLSNLSRWAVNWVVRWVKYEFPPVMIVSVGKRGVVINKITQTNLKWVSMLFFTPLASISHRFPIIQKIIYLWCEVIVWIGVVMQNNS